MRVILLLLTASLAWTAPWNAGAAKVVITPAKSMWMAGFASRTQPSQGVGLDLYARALALEDERGQRAVIVSAEMLGFTRDLAEAVSKRVASQYSIPRERLLLNATHTHSGPVVGRLLEAAYDMTPQQWAEVDAYTRELEDKLVAVVGASLKQLAPARLRFGQTVASFGVNRRPGFQPNYAGSADHDVPVLLVESEQGALRAVLFGYGCHPTTLSLYEFHGDFPGVASKYLEDRHAGAIAMFIQGTAGDVKPFPFGTVELAESYGHVLGATVDARLHAETPLVPVAGPLACAFGNVALPFAAPPAREELERNLHNDLRAIRVNAQYQLKLLERDGRVPRDYAYPLQAWQFGRDLTLLAMGGEVLSGYSLRLKKEPGGDRLWVAGYSNDDPGYIPTRQVVEEGGYEGNESMIYYMQPGPWAPAVEETVIGKAHELLKRVRN